LLTATAVAIDGSKFKAVNSRDRNFTEAKVAKRLEQIEASIERYLSLLEIADRQPEAPEIKRTHLKNKIDRLKQEIERMKAIGAPVPEMPDEGTVVEKLGVLLKKLVAQPVFEGFGFAALESGGGDECAFIESAEGGGGELAQAVERLLGLSERQQDRTVLAHMHDVVRGERVAWLDGLQRRLLHSAQAEDNTRQDGGFNATLGGRDGERAKRQALQFPGVFLEEPRQVDAEVRSG